MSRDFPGTNTEIEFAYGGDFLQSHDDGTNNLPPPMTTEELTAAVNANAAQRFEQRQKELIEYGVGSAGYVLGQAGVIL